MDGAYPDELWHSVADLSGLLLSEENLETTLRRVADLAVRTIPACDAVGVTLIEDDATSTRAATGGLVYEVDHYQYDIGEGPCLAAAQERVPIEVEEMDGSECWPRFCQHAAERGIHSSLSLPLIVRGEPLGALNLYSRRPRAFSTSDRETGLMFAAQAAVAVANTQTYAASVKLGAQLQEALVSRAVIDQAKGVLMAQNHCDEDAAFEMLQSVSQNGNTKLREIAHRVVKAARTVERSTPEPPLGRDRAPVGTGLTSDISGSSENSSCGRSRPDDT